MRIGIVTDQIDKNPYTGPSNYLRELIPKLLKFSDVELYLLHSSHNSNEIYDLTDEIVLPQRLAERIETIRKLKLDILHLNYLPKLREYWYFEAKTDIIVTVHGDEVWTAPQYVPTRKWIVYWRRILDFVTSKFVKRIIAVSNSLKLRIAKNLKLSPEKIDVIYNGVNHEIFKPINVNQRVFDNKGWNFEIGQYILHVSNYAPMKNAEGLIGAFNLLSRKYQDIKLVIAGGRWEEKLRELKALDKKNIVYVGKVPETDLALLYNGAICFVSPSLHETFGLTFVEAMACGCPVIGSNLTSMPEIIGDVGILVENPLNAVELYYAMLSIVEDPSLRKKMARKGIYRSSKFDWSKTAEGVYNVYRRTICS